MSKLAPIADRLAKFVRLLSSDQDGEVVAAARAICRTLKGAGLDIHALAEHIEKGQSGSGSSRHRGGGWNDPRGPAPGDDFWRNVYEQTERARAERRRERERARQEQARNAWDSAPWEEAASAGVHVLKAKQALKGREWLTKTEAEFLERVAAGYVFLTAALRAQVAKLHRRVMINMKTRAQANPETEWDPFNV